MNNFDFSIYDYGDISPTSSEKKISKKKEESPISFDFDIYESEPESIPQTKQEESNFSFRTAYQPISGILNTTVPGIIGNVWQLLATGEVLDPEELDHLEMVAKREGFPFDREEYLQKAGEVLRTIPSVSNIESAIEERTGAPLEPKTRFQKGLKFFTEATRLSPKPGTFRGMETGLPRPVLGAGVEATKELAQELGVPEPLAELASFGILKRPPEGAPSLTLGKEKPSGLTSRQFENIKEPREVSSGKIQQINKKLESDFREISEDIISKSPIGETAENLAKDITFKQQSRELLNQAQQIADSLPGTIPSIAVKKEIANIASKNLKGFKASEYDKSYSRFMKEAIDDIFTKEFRPGQMIEQYRKNNSELSEYFEPGASKALNRAKRDALLDQNRAIANAMEKVFPESELNEVFKSGNERWSKIMDAEAVDEFINEIFKEKIDYKKIHDFFDKENYGRIFKRSLGEEGYENFQQLLKDTLESEVPYKMLKVAKEKGFDDLVETGSAYVIHPNVGYAKASYDLSKKGYKFLINALLDKPQIGFTWKKGIDNLKKGNFAEAERDFGKLDLEVEKSKNMKENPSIEPKKKALKKFSKNKKSISNKQSNKN
jgi:hypothetical protein